MGKYSEIVILCEDLQQAVFARTFLAKCGIIRQRIRIAPLPAQGSGEGFVRKQYPLEVRAYRRTIPKKQVGLVVMIDADNRSVDDRFTELDRALVESGIDGRQPGEQIGIYIPKRNIETWIYFLKGKLWTNRPLIGISNTKANADPLSRILQSTELYLYLKTRHPLCSVPVKSWEEYCQKINLSLALNKRVSQQRPSRPYTL